MQAELLATGAYYQTRVGGSNDGFLTALYQDIANRPLDPVGQAGWRAYLNLGGSPLKVVHDVMASSFANLTVVEQVFEQTVHHSADIAGLAPLFNAASVDERNQLLLSVLAGVFNSVEYQEQSR